MVIDHLKDILIVFYPERIPRVTVRYQNDLNHSNALKIVTVFIHIAVANRMK